jgi:hypothetical protein
VSSDAGSCERLHPARARCSIDSLILQHALVTVKAAVLSSPNQQLTKKLAEMKSFLERRIKQQEEEVNSLRSFLEVVDSLLAERSFRQVEIPSPVQPADRVRAPAPVPSDSVPIMTTGGVRIASIVFDRDGMHVTPEPNVELDSDSPPLRSFLLGKVLDPMQTKDREAASSGAILPENILAYDLEQEDRKLKAIHIRNYGDDRRLLELKNAIRWTLRRMYEKTSAKKES